MSILAMTLCLIIIATDCAIIFNLSVIAFIGVIIFIVSGMFIFAIVTYKEDDEDE